MFLPFGRTNLPLFASQLTKLLYEPRHGERGWYDGYGRVRNGYGNRNAIYGRIRWNGDGDGDGDALWSGNVWDGRDGGMGGMGGSKSSFRFSLGLGDMATRADDDIRFVLG